eukprot:Lankesteria_metandrocarpae@DN4264_c0_g1_i2.p1
MKSDDFQRSSTGHHTNSPLLGNTTVGVPVEFGIAQHNSIPCTISAKLVASPVNDCYMTVIPRARVKKPRGDGSFLKVETWREALPSIVLPQLRCVEIIGDFSLLWMKALQNVSLPSVQFAFMQAWSADASCIAALLGDRPPPVPGPVQQSYSSVSISSSESLSKSGSKLERLRTRLLQQTSCCSWCYSLEICTHFITECCAPKLRVLHFMPPPEFTPLRVMGAWDVFGEDSDFLFLEMLILRILTVPSEQTVAFHMRSRSTVMKNSAKLGKLAEIGFSGGGTYTLSIQSLCNALQFLRILSKLHVSLYTAPPRFHEHKYTSLIKKWRMRIGCKRPPSRMDMQLCRPVWNTATKGTFVIAPVKEFVGSSRLNFPVFGSLVVDLAFPSDATMKIKHAPHESSGSDDVPGKHYAFVPFSFGTRVNRIACSSGSAICDGLSGDPGDEVELSESESNCTVSATNAEEYEGDIQLIQNALEGMPKPNAKAQDKKSKNQHRETAGGVGKRPREQHAGSILQAFVGVVKGLSVDFGDHKGNCPSLFLVKFTQLRRITFINWTPQDKQHRQFFRYCTFNPKIQNNFRFYVEPSLAKKLDTVSSTQYYEAAVLFVFRAQLRNLTTSTITFCPSPKAALIGDLAEKLTSSAIKAIRLDVSYLPPILVQGFRDSSSKAIKTEHAYTLSFSFDVDHLLAMSCDTTSHLASAQSPNKSQSYLNASHIQRADTGGPSYASSAAAVLKTAVSALPAVPSILVNSSELWVPSAQTATSSGAVSGRQKAHNGLIADAVVGSSSSTAGAASASFISRPETVVVVLRPSQLHSTWRFITTLQSPNQSVVFSAWNELSVELLYKKSQLAGIDISNEHLQRQLKELTLEQQSIRHKIYSSSNGGKGNDLKAELHSWSQDVLELVGREHMKSRSTAESSLRNTTDEQQQALGKKSRVGRAFFKKIDTTRLTRYTPTEPRRDDTELKAQSVLRHIHYLWGTALLRYPHLKQFQVFLRHVRVTDISALFAEPVIGAFFDDLKIDPAVWKANAVESEEWISVNLRLSAVPPTDDATTTTAGHVSQYTGTDKRSSFAPRAGTNSNCDTGSPTRGENVSPGQQKVFSALRSLSESNMVSSMDSSKPQPTDNAKQCDAQRHTPCDDMMTTARRSAAADDAAESSNYDTTVPLKTVGGTESKMKPPKQRWVHCKGTLVTFNRMVPTST